MQFRNALIALNSGIDYYCFGKSSNKNVIIGKDDWLFLTTDEEDDPINCYQGNNLFTEEELAKIAHNCIVQRDCIESTGREFIIFIAPNKERIYSEYMPDRYGNPANIYGALQIYNYLKENTDIRVVYPYEDLIKAKEKVDYNIYYKTDTHWNNIGGYVGTCALMDELGIHMPSIDSDKITIEIGDNTSGDLAGMLHLNNQLSSKDREYTIKGLNQHDYKCTEGDFFGMCSFQSQNADPRTIYVIRDSYASHMAGYIGSQFSNSYLRHESSYSYGDLISHDPDIVVYETVERFAYKLGSFSIFSAK
jgi:hypothetical protein